MSVTQNAQFVVGGWWVSKLRAPQQHIQGEERRGCRVSVQAASLAFTLKDVKSRFQVPARLNKRLALRRSANALGTSRIAVTIRS